MLECLNVIYCANNPLVKDMAEDTYRGVMGDWDSIVSMNRESHIYDNDRSQLIGVLSDLNGKLI
jgi:hypothetical protein